MPGPDQTVPSPPFGSQMLQAALQTAVGAIIIIDHQGLIRTLNPATEKLFGFAGAEMIGQNVTDADAGALSRRA